MYSVASEVGSHCTRRLLGEDAVTSRALGAANGTNSQGMGEKVQDIKGAHHRYLWQTTRLHGSHKLTQKQRTCGKGSSECWAHAVLIDGKDGHMVLGLGGEAPQQHAGIRPTHHHLQPKCSGL